MHALIESRHNRQHTWLMLRPIIAVVALVAMVASGVTWSSESSAPESKAKVSVYKTQTCGCCGKWVNHLRANGFEVEVTDVPDTSPVRQRLGVPERLASCHTATVGGYWVEGHVPAELIHELLAEEPENIRGIAAPGMPPGSPGMESPYALKQYTVVSLDADGQIQVYAQPQGRTQP